MKPIKPFLFYSFAVCCFAFHAPSRAAQAAGSPVGPSPDLSWASTPLDTMSTEHRAVESITNIATEEVTQKIHRYISIGTGLNFTNDLGILQESDESIRLLADGTAASTRARTKVYFAKSLTAPGGAITIVTSSNRVFKTSPVGLYYFDPVSGKSLLLAQIRDCGAEIYAPNRLVYKSATPYGDVVVTCARAGLETDFVLTKKPKPPEAYGLSPSSRLELWHEWFNTPDPQRKTTVLETVTDETVRATMQEPDFADETLDFKDLWLPLGRAFAASKTPAPNPNNPFPISVPGPARKAGEVSTGKRWIVTPEGRKVMIEAVKWSAIKPLLVSVPELSEAPLKSKPKDREYALRELPTQNRSSRPKVQPIKMAAGPYQPSGVTLDYIIIDSNGDYTFSANSTYYAESGTYSGGTWTFGQNCVVKFSSTSLMLTYGTVVCNGTLGSPSIFTTRDEDIFGETISGSSHVPSQNSSPMIYIYYVPSDLSFSGLLVRWAQTGMELDGNYCDVSHTVSDSSFQFCGTAIHNNGCNLTISNGFACSVSTTLDSSSCSVSGDLTDVCTGDADSNGLADLWECQYFGHIGVDPGADADADGLSNLQEAVLQTNPRTAATADNTGLINMQIYTPFK